TDSTSESVTTIDLHAPGCPAGVSKVQDGSDGDDNCAGVSEWWPATTHSVDMRFGDGTVVHITDPNYTDCFAASTANGTVHQDNQCNNQGIIWIHEPIANTVLWEFENPFISDNNNNGPTYVICAPSQDNPLVASDTLSGDCGHTEASKFEWQLALS